MNRNSATNANSRVVATAAAIAAAAAPPIIYKYPNPNPALPETYCPPINLTDTSGFSLFRNLIISCVKPTRTSQATYTKDMLQKCREPSDAQQMIDEYRDYVKDPIAHPHGDEKLLNLIETKNDVRNALKLVAPIQFRTLFEIPAEILNSALFVKPGTNPATPLIMRHIANSLNTTNFGCKKGEAKLAKQPIACANMDVPSALEIYTKFVDANDQNPLDLLLPLANRPDDPQNPSQKLQVKCNTDIRSACEVANPPQILSDRPFYIAINLFNSSTKSASHTAAIIVYKRQLYSIGLSNWAQDDQDLSHFRTKLDAKISSPENYVNSILYAVQQKKGKHLARIAVQNYQIIDIGFVTTDMIDKLDDYFKDMFQITATPDFSLTRIKNTGSSTIYATQWDPEFQATPSDLAYSRINSCYYNYLPIDPIHLRNPAIAAIAVALPSAAIGAVAAPLLGQDMTTTAAAAAATGAATGAALGIKYTPGFISKSTEPPRTRVNENRYIKSTNCSGFIEQIFGISCSKVLSRGSTGVGLAGQISAPTTCWLRISNAVLKQIISAVIDDDAPAFETALKGKSKYFNAALSGGKKKYKKTRKNSRKNKKQKTRKLRNPRKM